MVKKCIVFMTIVSLLFCPMEAKASADLVSQTSVSEYADSDFSYNDIDNLIDDRNTALMEQNYEYADQLTDTLHEHGIQTITLAELDALTGNTTPAAARSSAKFETVYGTYTTGGKKYNTMRVYATPSYSSNLYKSGVTVLKNTSKAKAGAMSLLNSVAESAAGIAASSTQATIALSVYDALKNLVPALSSTSTINTIKSSYTWNVAETCVFIFVKNSSGMWLSAAQYSKATASITVVTPTLSFGKNGAIASSVTKKYNINAIPKNYNSTAKAVSAYINGGEYNKARIKKLVIKGIQGKTVKSISLLNPDYPGSIT